MGGRDPKAVFAKSSGSLGRGMVKSVEREKEVGWVRMKLKTGISSAARSRLSVSIGEKKYECLKLTPIHTDEVTKIEKQWSKFPTHRCPLNVPDLPLLWCLVQRMTASTFLVLL